MEKRIIKQYTERYILVDANDLAGVLVDLPEDFIKDDQQITIVDARNQKKLEELYNDF
jgi:hypothetical protein